MNDATLYTLTGTYLAEPHLRGREVEVEIAKVEVHEFEKLQPGQKRGAGKVVKKPVLFFAKGSIPFGLTAKQNLVAAIKLLGRDMDKWVGQKITLTPSTCMAFGKANTPCIRIKI